MERNSIRTFSPKLKLKLDHYKYIDVLSKSLGMSKSRFIDSLVEQHAKRNPKSYKKALEIYDQLQSLNNDEEE